MDKYRPEPMRCGYCGRFLGFTDLESKRAFWYMVQPDSVAGPECWDGHHVACQDEHEKRERHRVDGEARDWSY